MGPLGKVWLAILFGIAGCASPGGPSAFTEGSAAEPLIASVPILVDQASDGERDPAFLRFLPSLEMLQSAVQSGEDALARRILARIEVRRPEGRALQLTRAFEAILDGRALAEALEAEVVAEDLPGEAGRYRLSLELCNRGADELLLRPGICRLHEVLFSVDPVGNEQNAALLEAVELPAEVRLAPDEPTRLDLCERRPPTPRGLLALRARYELELSSNHVVAGSRELPAMRIEVRPAEVVRLAAFLPAAALGPGQLIEYVEAGAVQVSTLLERTVRIPPERREETLALLTPLVGALDLPEVEEIAPALRWLTANHEAGADAAAWKDYFRARGSTPGPSKSRGAALDLPVAPNR